MPDGKGPPVREEQAIHNATLEVLHDIGIRIRNAKALDILKKNGIKTDGDLSKNERPSSHLPHVPVPHSTRSELSSQENS